MSSRQTIEIIRKGMTAYFSYFSKHNHKTCKKELFCFKSKKKENRYIKNLGRKYDKFKQSR